MWGLFTTHWDQNWIINKNLASDDIRSHAGMSWPKKVKPVCGYYALRCQSYRNFDDIDHLIRIIFFSTNTPVATRSKTGDKVKISEPSKTSIAGKTWHRKNRWHRKVGVPVFFLQETGVSVFKKKKNGFKTGIPVHRTGLLKRSYWINFSVSERHRWVVLG